MKKTLDLASLAACGLGVCIAAGCFGALVGVGCGSSGGGGGATTTTPTTTTGGNDSGGATETLPACTGPGALAVLFSPMYSAFVTDSTAHTFRVPAIVTGTTDPVSWSATPASAVSIAPDPVTGGAMITILAATPTVTITAQAGTSCASSVLTITPATEADWQRGNARYNNGQPVIPGCVGEKVKPLLGDSGVKIPPPPDGGCPDVGPACTGCHGDTPTAGFFAGVQHTPEQTGGFSDDALVDIFVNATDPTYDTAYLPYEYWHAFHTWTDIATPEDRKGMIVYLRSLTPENEDGGINFGQLTETGIVPD